MYQPLVELLRNTLAVRYPKIWEHRHFAYVYAEQAITSGVNYATTIMLIQGLSMAEFGRYGLMYSIMAIFIALHTAFLIYPMTSFLPQVAFDKRNPALQGWVLKQIAFVLLSFIGLMLVSVVVQLYFPQWQIDDYWVPMGVFMSASIMQEFLRRYFLIEAMYKEMLLYSVISNLTQLVALVVLIFSARFSLLAAMLTIAITTCLGVLYAFVRTTVFHPKRYTFEEMMLKDGLKLGGWNGLNTVVNIVVGQVSQAIVLNYLGFQVLGAIGALRSSFFGINLTITSLNNYILSRVIPLAKELTPIQLLFKLARFNLVLSLLMLLQYIVTGAIGYYFVAAKVTPVIGQDATMGLLVLNIALGVGLNLCRSVDFANQILKNAVFPSLVKISAYLIELGIITTCVQQLGVYGLFVNISISAIYTYLVLYGQFLIVYLKKPDPHQPTVGPT